MTDKIMITIMALAMIFLTHYVSYEYGKKAQCEKSEVHLYSFDFSRCFEISEAKNAIRR